MPSVTQRKPRRSRNRPPAQANGRDGSQIRPNRYSRWRAGTLAGVYVLMVAHITHWKLSGQTLAPLELNEVMYTLELGIITAGFIFMALAALSAAVFGRFFCSWGCHILALEDLCAWLLGKIGIRPKPVRSRVLLLVPPAALFYMFVWPQVSRIIQGRPAPMLHMATDQQGWASFMTTDFWRNLPGPWIIAITFLICGFAIVYVLGSRGFCTYGCPYGVLFSLADRIAPGKIVLKGDCEQCGTCTAHCSSHVRVHEEIAVFGKVVNPACMKDLDCIAVCPQEALGYGFTRPSLWKKLGRSGGRGVIYDFSLGEEALMAGVFLASLLIFRGLYGAVPFLMTLAIGAILAYAAVLTVRLFRRHNVRFNNYQLKRAGALTGWGKTFMGLAATLAVFCVHSGYVRYHEFFGHRAFDAFRVATMTGNTAASAAMIGPALAHLEACERWGVFEHPAMERRMAALYEADGSPDRAEVYLQRVLDDTPGDAEARLSLGRLLVADERRDAAAPHLRLVVRAIAPAETVAGQYSHYRAAAHQMLGEIEMTRGRFAEARKHLDAALAEHPDSAAAHLSLGELLANQGLFADAAERFTNAIKVEPESAPAHYNLAVMLAAQDKTPEALAEYRTALELDPSDPETHNNLGHLLLEQGETGDAETHFRKAIEVDASYAHAHFNLGRLLYARGSAAEANQHFQEAARLSPRYAELLRSETPPR